MNHVTSKHPILFWSIMALVLIGGGWIVWENLKPKPPQISSPPSTIQHQEEQHPDPVMCPPNSKCS